MPSTKSINSPGRGPSSLVFHLLGGIVLLFIIVPLITLAIDTAPSKFFEVATENQEVRHSIGLTIWTSMAATLGMAVAAVPFAWWLARTPFRGKAIINAVVDLPVVIPHSAAGIAILGVLSRDSVIGGAAASAGINFVGHPVAIMAAMAFVSLPFLINQARDGFAAVPERLERAALNLGASPLRVFWTVSLPLAWPSVLSGLVLMWARGMSEFGAVVFIAYRPAVAPVLLWDWFGTYGLDYARPLALLLIVIALVMFVAFRLLAWRADYAQR